MKGTQERRAGRRLRIDESAPSSRIKRRREKEEQKRKYVPSRLLAFLFLALPAVVLAIHHVQSKSDTVTVVRHEDQSSRETVRIIQDDEVKRTEQAAKSKQKSAADRGSVGGREKKTDDEQGKIITHVVAANETLYSIAMKYYGTPDAIDLIKKENGLSTGRLQPGQTLRIPLDENH
ncbi:MULTISPECIES: LysM peptidoglycan-binding domain-containing protein [Geobacillus]|uniref:LysM peptidoglycan-binding domain-containing protein n=1 Tax=Geobacillus TaxID=129337 RepID=UPI0005A74A72|nr:MULTISPECIES: LysM peptidoglycan-binding domain-containing protein [Geobacillus]AOL35000.1 peptidoglycan-binding protein [Geobacillus thermoleovorans]MBW7643458.1 LysM peptidoglycan-binding domain-containing protein [Geobacillus thermoleovorans]MED4974160.1 LysM peptidoglycan-binding domain-containing protein [Geobacillus thermoleovorans]QCK83374.1 LysM domain-containing protein [Geobacillus kaustophilus NBRC 102445]TRY44020.1 LysM domain-containing protein [Geobacillus sp. LEMMJ02]